MPGVLTAPYRRAAFIPRLAAHSDDMVVMQALVAAGMGVSILPGLAFGRPPQDLHHATELTEDLRRHLAASLPRNPSAVVAVLSAFVEAGRDSAGQLRRGNPTSDASGR